MKTFQYTVSGFIPYGNREVMAGDELDFPITSEIADVPNTIRTVVISVVDTIVNEVAGHTYDIQYDETLLGGNLLALDPCCDVGMPTAVTTDLLLAEHIANSPFILKGDSNVESAPSVRAVYGPELIVANQGTSTKQYDPVDIMLEALDISNPSDYDFSLTVEIFVAHDEPTNGSDSLGVYKFVGNTSNGTSLFTVSENVHADTFIDVTTPIDMLQVLVRNDSATLSQNVYRTYTFTAFKR